MKKKKYDLLNMEAVEIYKLVLSGAIIRFPKGFWMQPEAKQNAIKITKYLLENVLQYTDDDIKTKVDGYTFNNNKLNSMLNKIYNGSPYECINSVYPDKFKQWELSNGPKNFWNKETTKEATKWLLEEKLKYTEEDIKTKVNYNTFKNNGLDGMISRVFNGSVFECINNAYPDKFKEWELSSTPRSFWNKDTTKEATKWLLEEKLQYTEEDIKTKVNQYTFKNNGLIGMLHTMFNNSPYECINNVYPNKFKEWELSTTPKNFWNKETAKEATKWLLEEKLKYSDEDIKTKVKYNTFKNNGLGSMIHTMFYGSSAKCLKNAYPELFKDEK